MFCWSTIPLPQTGIGQGAGGGGLGVDQSTRVKQDRVFGDLPAKPI